MRRIERFPKPAVLVENEVRWLDEHIKKVEQDPSVRPPSKQYSHPEIRQTLRDMSHSKCFYCEQALAEHEGQIDHHVEVSLRPDLAFSWLNLHLSCAGCNDGKPRDNVIPASSCVDPCDPHDDPARHLEYEDSTMRGIPSTKGTTTIRKYRLNRPDLELRRAKLLLQFKNVLIAISGQMNTRMRQQMSDEQKKMLRGFAEPDRPFSAMFTALLAQIPALAG